MIPPTFPPTPGFRRNRRRFGAFRETDGFFRYVRFFVVARFVVRFFVVRFFFATVLPPFPLRSAFIFRPHAFAA